MQKPAWGAGSCAIGAPGFEPGTSPTRTVRATRLRHAPKTAEGTRRRPRAGPRTGVGARPTARGALPGWAAARGRRGAPGAGRAPGPLQDVGTDRLVDLVHGQDAVDRA